MAPNIFFILLIVIPLIILVDVYTFKGLKILLKRISNITVRTTLKVVYWVWSIAVELLTILLFFRFSEVVNYTQTYKSYFIPFTVIAILIINLLPKLWFIFFHLLEDMSWLGFRKVKKITAKKNETSGELMDRFTFISRVGLAIAGIQLGWLLYGVTKGRFNFKVVKETLEFDNLPASFDGLRIVQVSDIHIGSFYDNYDEVAEGIDLVNSLNADIIFLTGDLINNYAWELDGWENILKRLKAKMGVYSILGNHDYGDYATWKTEEEKAKNLADLERRQQRMGFRLLKNQSVKLQKDTDYIELIGVENWGKSSFANYGNLSQAMQNSSSEAFKILLSHDPTHWEAEVVGKADIDLTFSGHTHGMQFGVEIPGIKWSPAKYLYKYWAGLYKEKNQVLYVNRGFGFTIFPGRVGISPEITLVTLRKKHSL